MMQKDVELWEIKGHGNQLKVRSPYGLATAEVLFHTKENIFETLSLVLIKSYTTNKSSNVWKSSWGHEELHVLFLFTMFS